MISITCPVCASKKTHVNEGKRRSRWVCAGCGSEGEHSTDLGTVVFKRADINKVSHGSGRRLLRDRGATRS